MFYGIEIKKLKRLGRVVKPRIKKENKARSELERRTTVTLANVMDGKNIGRPHTRGCG